MVSFIDKMKKNERKAKRKIASPQKLSTLQFQIVVGVVIAVVIALLITAVYYLTRIASLQIEQVEVIGGQTIPHKVIEDKAQSALIGSYFLLVPKKFIPFYPKDAIESSIASLDRVKNVQVEISDNQTLSIIFDEYTPYALWCESLDSETCLFIDSVGFAFAQAPELEGSAFVRYTESGVVPKLESTSFDPQFVKESSTFVSMLAEKLSLYVTHVSKISTYDVEYTISGGGVLKVSQTIPMEESFKNLEAILSSEEFAYIEPGSFQYIDLRFGDKIFVNEVLPSSTSTTTSTTSNPL